MQLELETESLSKTEVFSWKFCYLYTEPAWLLPPVSNISVKLFLNALDFCLQIPHLKMLTLTVFCAFPSKTPALFIFLPLIDAQNHHTGPRKHLVVPTRD